MIDVKGLNFYYGKKQVLRDVNLNLSKGFNVLLGPNGAGKSTFVSLLTHLLTPSEGEILVNGYSLSTQTRQVMSQYGVVFQQPTLDLDLTIKQNLTYHGSLHGLSPSKVMSNCEVLLRRLNLTERLNEKVRNLNGGHRRRVEIIRALAHQPSLVLLDEASVGLDNDSRFVLINYLREVTVERNLCVIWTTHLLDEIELSDHLVVLDNGKIIADHKVSALHQQCDTQTLSELYRRLTNQGALNAI